MYSAAQSAALAPRREVPLLIAGSNRRLANVYLHLWNSGQPEALDVSITLTMK